MPGQMLHRTPRQMCRDEVVHQVQCGQKSSRLNGSTSGIPLPPHAVPPFASHRAPFRHADGATMIRRWRVHQAPYPPVRGISRAVHAPSV